MQIQNYQLRQLVINPYKLPNQESNPSRFFMCHRMGSLNARAFLEKLVTHLLIMQKTSSGLWENPV